MRGFFFRLIITALGLWAAAAIIPGVRIDDWRTLIIGALLLGIVNAVIRPIILILTLPLTVLTLGLFILVVNGISLSLVAWVLPGVHIGGLGAALPGPTRVRPTRRFAPALAGGSGPLQRDRRVGVGGGGPD